MTLFAEFLGHLGHISLFFMTFYDNIKLSSDHLGYDQLTNMVKS